VFCTMPVRSSFTLPAAFYCRQKSSAMAGSGFARSGDPAYVAVAAYLYLSVCLIYALPDKYHREVGGWTYSRKAQTAAGDDARQSRLRVAPWQFESDVEAVFSRITR